MSIAEMHRTKLMKIEKIRDHYMALTYSRGDIGQFAREAMLEISAILDNDSLEGGEEDAG